jgi:hypothetical protein
VYTENLVKSAQGSGMKRLLKRATNRHILFQGSIGGEVVVVVHARQKHMTKMLLAEHENVVKALPSDRTVEPIAATSANREWLLIEVIG